MYPTKIKVKNHVYPINTDYRVALSCFKAINDNEITEISRAYIVIQLLLGDVRDEDYCEELVEKCAKYLRCGHDENVTNSEIDMDYFQDEALIRTSIRQCYHENINDIKYLHWYEYNELIEGLTEETALNQIRQIRTYDLSMISDEKEKERMQKAKERVALKKTTPKRKLTKKEEQSLETFNNFFIKKGSDIK